MLRRYLGPGMMNLMTSAAPWWLQPILWFFGLSGTESKAYEYLSTAYEKGTLVRVEAGTYLAQLYERRKEYGKSYETYSAILRQYPMRVALRAESLTPLWTEKRYGEIIEATKVTIEMFQSGQFALTKGDSAWMSSIVPSCAAAYSSKGDTSSAIEILEDFIAGREYRNIGKRRAHGNLCDLYLNRGDTTRAVWNLKEILKGELSEKDRERISGRVKELENLQTR